jgi:hypothetical protein
MKARFILMPQRHMEADGRQGFFVKAFQKGKLKEKEAGVGSASRE